MTTLKKLFEKVSIKNISFDSLKHMDLYIVIPYVVLSLFGLVMIYSASSYFALTLLGNSESFLYKQLLFMFLGFMVAMLVYVFGKKILKQPLFFMIGGGILLLSLLYVLTTEAQKGAKSWISIGSFGIQPSEFAKVYLIWLSSYFYAQHKDEEKIWPFIRVPFLSTLFVLLLVILQPDLGTLGIILLIMIFQFVATGFYKWGMPVAVTVISFFYLLTYLPSSFIKSLPIMQYQIGRLVSFHNPWSDPLVTGYQAIQGYLGLARGGWTGNGLATSVQKTGFLPEAHTDFILAIIGEELGFFVVLLVLALLFYLTIMILIRSAGCKYLFSKYLCFGVGTMFLVQLSINIGAVLGLAPITGIPLPFISYGGSSYIVSSIGIGLVLYAIHEDKEKAVENKESVEE